MRNSKEVTLKEALNQMIDLYKIRGKLAEGNIQDSWEKIMGKVISSQTQNIYIKEKVLFVTLNSSSMRQELHYLKEKIKTRLNQEIGSRVIDDIVFK